MDTSQPVPPPLVQPQPTAKSISGFWRRVPALLLGSVDLGPVANIMAAEEETVSAYRN
jgi:hypothetical protein